MVLEGTGWIDLKEIRRNGLPVAVTWLDLTRWRVTLPLLAGANVLQLEAVGFDDAVQATQSLTITSTTAAEPRPRDLLRMTEIHYHPANPTTPAELAASSSDSDFEFIELKNIGTQTVTLAGMRFTAGLDYTFPAGTQIAGGSHLVVAADPAALRTKFPTITVIGPFVGTLSRNGERIMLRDAIGNPVATVNYFDDGRWPEEADGGGSSLELRDPRANLDAGENWAASDESSRASWKSYVYEGTAAASAVGPDGQWKEFVLGLLDKGEVLLDDISVVEAPATTAHGP